MSFRDTAPLTRLIPAGLMALSLLLAGRPAMAGAPYVVDDGYLSPFAPPERGCQVEAWWVSSPSQGQFNFFPTCQFIPNLDLTLAATFNFPVGGPNSTDVTIQLKRSLFSSGGNDLAMSAGTIIRPDNQAGDSFLRSGFVYAAFTHEIGGKLLTMNYNLGWTHDAATPRNLATWGIRARVTPQERFDLAAEYFGDSQEPPFVQAGIRIWLVPDYFRLMTSVGQQLSREGFWTLGISLYSPPFLSGPSQSSEPSD